jgi:hypothetical protein
MGMRRALARFDNFTGYRHGDAFTCAGANKTTHSLPWTAVTITRRVRAVGMLGLPSVRWTGWPALKIDRSSCACATNRPGLEKKVPFSPAIIGCRCVREGMASGTNGGPLSSL